MTRLVHVWLRPNLQLLDITGPAEVLAAASQVAALGGHDGYTLEMCASGSAPVRTTAGVTLQPDAPTEGLLDRATADATLLVPGALADGTVAAGDELTAAIAGFPGRVVSICAGAFELARAGRLDGRRATTHWLFTRRFARLFPAVDVEPDALWVHDGDVWTSAGVSAGIDLALALVEADLGRQIALEVARLLVLHMKRPGGQSQFSAVLDVQRDEASPLTELLVWMHDHPEADLRVPALARRVAMSPRHFARVFVRHTGSTPAAVVRQLRLAAARRMLEDDRRASLVEIAERTGHGTAESLRRAFVKTLGVPPGAYRDRFAGA
ncbi:MAG: helix-turn-helix domain-containing protein [Myxococcota bacterium]